MKILHTSDWHLGHCLYGYDRNNEFEFFFSQLLDILKRETPDALLVSGDLYDVSSPAISVIEIFNSFMLKIRKELPEMTVVVISGNHDSASRIDVYRNVWEKIGVHVIGKVERNNRDYKFSDNVISIEGKGRIVAVPFINPSFMWSETKEKSGEEFFFNSLENEIKSSYYDNLPTVLMAHLTVAGTNTNYNFSSQIGNLNPVNSDIFGSTFDYIALGHIHKPQSLEGNKRIRYSGSPIPISFDEDYDHSVSLVEIEKDELPIVKEIIISPHRKLLTVPEKAVNFKSALKYLFKIPENDTSYIRLNVEQSEDLPADCEEQAAAATVGKNCRYCLIKYTKPGKDPNISNFSEMRVSDFKLLNPTEIAVQFFKTVGLEDKEICELKTLLSEIEEELTVKNNI